MKNSILLDDQEIFEVCKICSVDFEELTIGQKKFMKKLLSNITYLAKQGLLDEDRMALEISVSLIPRMSSIEDLQKVQPNLFSVM